MWTHGWDLMAPVENILYHYYYRAKIRLGVIQWIQFGLHISQSPDVLAADVGKILIPLRRQVPNSIHLSVDLASLFLSTAQQTY